MDEAHVRLGVPVETQESFALFVAGEERRSQILELDDLLVLRTLARRSVLDRWSVAEVLQVPEHEAADRLVRLREVGYLVVRGRGRGASYDLRRNLADRLRGQSAVNADYPLDEEAVRLRIIALLREREKLTNTDVRRLSGFSRTQVYHLLKKMEENGDIRFVGHGARSTYSP